MGYRQRLRVLLLGGLLIATVACTSAVPAAIRRVSPGPSPSPSSTMMPNLIGQTGGQARSVITSVFADSLLHVTPTVFRRDSRKAPGMVFRQKPPAGTDVTEPPPITFWIARPFPRVPAVVGVGWADAKKLLRAAHFTISVRFLTSSGPTGIVEFQKPTSGARVHTGAIVTIAARICTPGYSPCLLRRPYGLGYNCWGNGGSPPLTQPDVTYTVNPRRDIYRLDADHDGEGCEQG